MSRETARSVLFFVASVLDDSMVLLLTDHCAFEGYFKPRTHPAVETSWAKEGILLPPRPSQRPAPTLTPIPY